MKWIRRNRTKNIISGGGALRKQMSAFEANADLGGTSADEGATRSPAESEAQRILIVGRPSGAKFLVEPPTAVVTSPNLSAHKPAGNCASGDNDGP